MEGVEEADKQPEQQGQQVENDRSADAEPFDFDNVDLSEH